MRKVMKNRHQVKNDCFAFIADKINGCKILDCLYCRFEDCKFYKPKTNNKKLMEKENE